VAWTVDEPGVTLAAFVKARAGVANSLAKRQIAAGKVFVDGACVTTIDLRLTAGQQVEVRTNAPKPHDPEREGVLVYDDAHVVVIDKPSGINSVPYEERETGTAMDLIRGAWRRQGKAATTVPLHVVHRIDRATSGLLMFAKTKKAELGLAAQLRAHSLERQYRCVAHGTVTSRRIESHLVEDRGDGLRGSTTRLEQGKRAVTHVTADRALHLSTLCSVRLETGKTHQIRIHLSEAGHPVCGDKVYCKLPSGETKEDNSGAPRLALHATELGFAHPITGEAVHWGMPLPKDLSRFVERLKGAAK
jgi:23S rRNA pseudouridine1911/1915/1917 synthase